MKPEMNMMNLLPGDGKPIKSAPGPKAAKLIGINDPKRAENIPEEGVAAPVTRKAQEPEVDARFKKILESVAEANKQAQKAAADKGSKDGPESSGSGDQTSGMQVDFTELNSELVALGISPADVGMDVTDADKGTQLTQASDIIQNAISKISKMLNIKINPGLENLQLANPSQNVVDQFAEILNALKGIAGLLDEAVKNNEPIEISGKVFDMAQAAEVEKTLRVETFQIEMALEMAGVSGDVAQSAAQKNNLPADGGIVTALDPALISMPASQIKQALGNTLLLKEQTVETLFSKLAETLKGNTVSDKMQLVNKIAAVATGVDTKNVQVEALANTAGEQAGKASVPGTFGSGIMRALLKIDPASGAAMVDAKAASMLQKTDSTEAGNLLAAQGSEKLDLSKTMKVILAKNLAGEVDQSGDDKAVSMLADASKGQADSLIRTVDLRSAALPKTIEESIMNQLSDKVQTALKTGVTEIRLLLRPESLGEMRVKLTIDGDVVMGKIYVENQQVKHIVESNLQMLKDSLAQHNLQAGSFDVNVNGGDREDLREMANRPLQSGMVNNNEIRDKDQNVSDKDVSTGQDTGRRFGTNTIEYFV
jgi:flagellar hook-length control protein FliK